jgi:hypothetical protein
MGLTKPASDQRGAAPVLMVTDIEVIQNGSKIQDLRTLKPNSKKHPCTEMASISSIVRANQ